MNKALMDLFEEYEKDIEESDLSSVDTSKDSENVAKEKEEKTPQDQVDIRTNEDTQKNQIEDAPKLEEQINKVQSYEAELIDSLVPEPVRNELKPEIKSGLKSIPQENKVATKKPAHNLKINIKTPVKKQPVGVTNTNTSDVKSNKEEELSYEEFMALAEKKYKERIKEENEKEISNNPDATNKDKELKQLLSNLDEKESLSDSLGEEEEYEPDGDYEDSEEPTIIDLVEQSETSFADDWIDVYEKAQRSRKDNLYQNKIKRGLFRINKEHAIELLPEHRTYGKTSTELMSERWLNND